MRSVAQAEGLAVGRSAAFVGGRLVLVMAVLPDAEDDPGDDEADEGPDDDGAPAGEIAVEPAEEAAAVEEGESGFGAVTEGASDADGGEELAAGRPKGSGGEEKGQQGDGRGEEGGDGDAEQAVVFDPAFEAGAIALGDIAVDHGFAAFFSGFPGEPGADEAACDAHGSEEPGILAVCSKDKDEDVDAAGDGKGDGGGVEQSDEEDACNSEVEDPGGEEGVAGVFC